MDLNSLEPVGACVQKRMAEHRKRDLSIECIFFTFSNHRMVSQHKNILVPG